MHAIGDVWLGLLKSWTRTTSFLGKEITEVVRRPGALFSLIFGPFLIMGAFGLGYSGQYRPLATVLVVPANSGLSSDAAYYQQFAGESVRIVGVTQDVENARSRLQRQEIDLLVVAPENVEERFRNGEQSLIQIEYNELDPVRDNYARFIAFRQVQEINRVIIENVVGQGQQYILQAAGGQAPVQVSPQVVAAPTRAEPRNLAPQPPNVVSFFAPAVLALVLQHMGVTLTALSMVRERLSGALDIFKVAPLRTLELLVGKYLAYAFFNLSIAALVCFLLVGVLHVPLLSQPGDVAWVILLLSFASLGLGLLISTIVDSERQAVQLSMLVLLASVFFSGFVLPLDQFLTPLRLAAYTLPVTHGIQLLQDLMLRGGTNEGWELNALGAIGVVLFGLTWFTLRRNMASAK
jgi:ABC-2 type transport system permease protein